MIILISPSKTQNFECRKLSRFSLPVCLEQTKELVQVLKNYSETELGALMNLSPKLAKLNFGRFQTFNEKFDLLTAKQALLAFKGDVYSGISTDRYAEEDFGFAQNHLRIISGLYGVLKPLDLIQPYRLEMGTKLAVGAAGNLYKFWGSRLTKAINSDLEKMGSTEVVNLASNEYSKALQPKGLTANMVTVVFKEKKGDAYKVVAIHAKRARGLMTDFIIKNRITVGKDLHGFSEKGYLFNPTLSSDSEYVFCRE